ncbi:hypothetical protein E2C01_052776 [Portunus trituberculatus]|uniref:Uncharacterized protein n=1 Tax=Portunus trituberculatus TaxID=210409 RepID=A0A5B7GP50_PORTR|nr:hypothetical protein [Portunus trituberculatus]
MTASRRDIDGGGGVRWLSSGVSPANPEARVQRGKECSETRPRTYFATATADVPPLSVPARLAPLGSPLSLRAPPCFIGSLFTRSVAPRSHDTQDGAALSRGRLMLEGSSV